MRDHEPQDAWGAGCFAALDYGTTCKQPTCCLVAHARGHSDCNRCATVPELHRLPPWILLPSMQRIGKLLPRHDSADMQSTYVLERGILCTRCRGECQATISWEGRRKRSQFTPTYSRSDVSPLASFSLSSLSRLQGNARGTGCTSPVCTHLGGRAATA